MKPADGRPEDREPANRGPESRAPLATYLGGLIGVCSGDITTWHVDAIVNAANSSLLGGGGVDGAIHRAGGPSIVDECRRIRRARYPDGLPTGEAVVTGAGDLPARWVIHTVGPVYSGSPDPDGELASAYTRSIEEARRVGAASIAFPAISTGVYGFPKHLAARVVARTLAHIVTAQPAPTVDLVYFSVADAELFVTETEHHVPELERD